MGEVIEYDAKTGMVDVDVKNKFAVGDRLELILPHGNRSFVLENMEDMHGRPMHEVPGGGYKVRIPVGKGEYRMGLLAKYL